jgi:hypothetical protein
MKTRIIGDVHGHKYELEWILDNLPADVSEVIQVGDLGVGFGQSVYWHQSLDNKFQSVNGRWIRGNHDDPSTCKEMKTWIPDGTITNDWMFIGGAWSIDRARRIEGLNWWKDEELSYEELYRLTDIYQFVLPSVMITHDVAESVATKMFLAQVDH